MAFVKACSALDVRPGEMTELTVAGRPVLICGVDDSFYAVHPNCPHLNGPLAYGVLRGPIITCPWHAWDFDCRTGESDMRASLKTYPVRVEQGDIYVDVE